MSAQKDQDYFCEGMAEELINAFSKLDGLRVASRTSAFRFKGAEDIRKIGEQLGVETVLEGSVRTAGNRLRVTAQLTNVAEGYQIWSERYDRHMEDVFDIQDEIARAIVGALKVKLLADRGTNLVKRGTANLEAYHLCLKARYHWFKWTDEGFGRAMQLFQEALALDPDYPLALFGVADSYSAMAFVGIERDPRACVSMLEKAIRLDPGFAEARAVLGIHEGMWMWRWSAAQQSFETAMQINPRDPHVFQLSSLNAALLGRADEAVILGRRSLELDPLNPFWNAGLALVYLHNRRFDEAVQQANVTLDLVPTFWMANAYAGLAHAALGDLTRALAALERAVADSRGVPYASGWLAFVLGKAGQPDAARAQLDTLLNRAADGYLPALTLACVYAGLSDSERALDAVARAYVQRDPWLSTHLGPSFIFDDLRANPRFVDVHRRVFGSLAV
jgi:serine/threonine-protein kinase